MEHEILREIQRELRWVREQLKGLKHDMATANSAITAFAAQVEANFSAIATGITALDAKIKALQDSTGTLSTADQAALDQIVADSAKLAKAAQAVVPPVPVV